MTRRRAGLAALLGAALLAFAAEPVAAQPSASTTVEQIWNLNMNLLYVAIPITVLVEGILIYTVWRFRKREEPLPTMENRRLEITWTVATAVILLFVGVASYQVLASPFVTAESTNQAELQTEEVTHIEVQAYRYGWTFYYNGSSFDETTAVTSTGTLRLPANQEVNLRITSRDWLHAFHVPSLGLKADAFPGQYNHLRTVPTETGTYQLYCAEYCGSGHSQMLGTVQVMPQDEYDQWLQEQRTAANSSGNETSGGNTTSANETATPAATPTPSATATPA
ncbi:cytochrome c oxidase subunit II [Haloarcula onubensis]|uniref:cytochrome-c oxidase n=1 Tax=Haloarcula onubensis TaxID=2950539 RepID=A0ABU2FMW3_9EURY|nr:cytochrome c oxidase subunit II [Halomicroarcula sp. S3CR25-11]MDS0281526.1 cytochrome c oxidase subunit II [Halomicroarcula sp. S3CR25-11]